MKKVLIAILLIITCGDFIYAQNELDALRYSRSTSFGTARFNAMGGAFGALGGDISSATINPGGIGVYRSSEFTFTTGFLFSDTETNFRNELRNDNRFNFNISNIGYVASYPGRDKGLKQINIAFGYNRLANFSNAVSFQSNSNGSSAVDAYINQLDANPTLPDQLEATYPFGAYLAYYTLLIDPLPSDSTLYVRRYQGNDIQQNQTLITRGSMGETFFSVAINSEDRLYFGATVGIPTLRYVEERRYSEDYGYTPVAQPQDSLLVGFDRTEDLITRGIGINAKIGMIYRITDAVRIGAAIHTPTFFALSDEYSSQITSRFSDGAQFSSGSPLGEFDYRLRTPTKLIGSLGFVVARKAIFSVDYEYLNFSQARLRDAGELGSNYDFNTENDAIQQIYSSANNIRVGGEYRLDPYTIRAGFRYEDNPFINSIGADESRMTYSVGAGYRNGNGFSLDFAYLLSRMSRQEFTYVTVDAPVNIQDNQHFLTITAGFRF